MSTGNDGEWIRTERKQPYVCYGCDETFALEHYVCPECGSFSVERRGPR